MAATSGARMFARAGHYRSRPGHIDPAHVDVWIAGKAVAIDAGTYRYMAPAPWGNGLAVIDVHNTVSIAGIEAARRGPRFLWLAWPRARIAAVSVVGDEVVIDIVNESWEKHGITHRRRCTLRAEGASIIDEIGGSPTFTAPVHVQWLLEEGSNLRVACAEESTVTEVRGDGESTRGWVADSYGSKRPARSVRLTAKPRGGELRIVSTFENVREPSAMTRVVAADAEAPCST